MRRVADECDARGGVGAGLAEAEGEGGDAAGLDGPYQRRQLVSMWKGGGVLEAPGEFFGVGVGGI